MHTFNEWLNAKQIYHAACNIGLEKEIKKYDFDELIMGMKIEREHAGEKGKDVVVAKNDTDILKIVIAHMREDEHYYTKLAKAKL